MLHAANPKLIMLRISGYGQTGPYRDKPGFGVLGEAMGGLRHLTGEPGRVPVRVGVSIGDTLSALHGVIGVLTALRHREVNGGEGQVVDVALYESVFNVMESLVPEYDAFGAVRGAAGSALPGIAPTNAYPCNDGQYVLVAGNGDSIFKRLMKAIGRPDLENDPALAHNDGRVQRVEEIDAAIAEWTRERTPRRGARDARRDERAGGPRLHRRRHRQRPAVPGARDDRRVADVRRPHAEGAGGRAQAQRHAGADRACRAEPRTARRRPRTWRRLARAPVLKPKETHRAIRATGPAPSQHVAGGT